MIKTRQEIINIKIYVCDICQYSTENNSGCCGSSPIMQCNYCKRHFCRNCRIEWAEYNSDYTRFISCFACEWYLDFSIEKFLEEQEEEDFEDT